MRDHQRGGGSVHGNLPLELNAFVGRSAELAELEGALGAARLVTVTGASGVGTSRLAARAAVRCAPRDGVWRVESAPVRDPEFVDYAVVEALGLTDHTTRVPRETLLALPHCLKGMGGTPTAERQLLLVLDGFEPLVEVCAGLVGELLGRLPGLRVLAVGRRPLGVAGERVFPLAPLGEDEAVALLLSRAAEQGPAVADGPEVREVCRRLDGIPLAVELAAGRLRALSPGQLLDRLDDRFRLLTGGGRDAPADSRLRSSPAAPPSRHRTLRPAIGWSPTACLHMHEPAASRAHRGGETAG